MAVIKSIRVTIKRPGKTRRSYCFIQDIRYLDDSRTQDICKLQNHEKDSLDQINSKYYDSKDLNLCNKLAEELKERVLERLQKEHKLITKRVFNQDNYSLLDEWFNYTYEARKTKDKATVYNDFRRAIDSLGSIPLRTASKKEIENKLKDLSSQKQRRVVSRLQRILEYLERDLILERDKKQRPIIKYLNESEFDLVLQKIKDPIDKLVFEGLWASGCRLGEFFALESDDYRYTVLNIDKQMLRPSEAIIRKLASPITATKNEKPRKLIPLLRFDNVFKDWSKVSYELKLELRKKRWAEILKTACEKAFPKNTRKHCVAHDLRHSFAVTLLSMGVNISMVAQSLGDSVQVCEEYYVGFILTNESLEFLKNIVRK